MNDAYRPKLYYLLFTARTHTKPSGRGWCITQAELARRLGRSQTWVSKVENGHKPNIRWADVVAWCAACDITVAELATQLGV